MQIHAQAQVGQLAPGAPGIPPGLLGHPGGPPGGLPTSMSLLAGIPTSLAQAGAPHPAFASLLAAQKPAPDHMTAASKLEDMKRSVAETNGGKFLINMMYTLIKDRSHQFAKCPVAWYSTSALIVS